MRKPIARVISGHVTPPWRSLNAHARATSSVSRTPHGYDGARAVLAAITTSPRGAPVLGICPQISQLVFVGNHQAVRLDAVPKPCGPV